MSASPNCSRRCRSARSPRSRHLPAPTARRRGAWFGSSGLNAGAGVGRPGGQRRVGGHGNRQRTVSVTNLSGGCFRYAVNAYPVSKLPSASCTVTGHPTWLWAESAN